MLGCRSRILFRRQWRPLRFLLGRRLNQSHTLERLIRQLHVKSTALCGWRESISIAQVTDNEGLTVLRRQYTGSQIPEQLGTEATLLTCFSTQVSSCTSGSLPLGTALRGQRKDIFKGYHYGRYTKLHFSPLAPAPKAAFSSREKRAAKQCSGAPSVCGSTALRPRPRPPAGDSSAGCDNWRRTGRKRHPGWSPQHTRTSIYYRRGDTKDPDANVTHASFLHHRTITQTTYPTSRLGKSPSGCQGPRELQSRRLGSCFLPFCISNMKVMRH